MSTSCASVRNLCGCNFKNTHCYCVCIICVCNVLYTRVHFHLGMRSLFRQAVLSDLEELADIDGDGTLLCTETFDLDTGFSDPSLNKFVLVDFMWEYNNLQNAPCPCFK